MPCKSLLLLLLIITALVSACSEAPSDAQLKTHTKSDNVDKQVEQGKSHLAEKENSKLFHSIHSLSQRKFSNLLSCAQTLEQEAVILSRGPTEAQLLSLQNTWLDCHNSYLSTRLFRIWPRSLEIHHPVLDVSQSNPELIHSNHSRIDQHPVIPGYLDSVPGYPLSGLIHSDIELNESVLHQEHQLGDPAYVALGFHALKFMLYGEEGSLKRLVTDFAPLSSSSKDISKRRRTRFVLLLSQLLLADIEKLSEAWLKESDFYPDQLIKRSEKELKTSLSQVSEVELEAVKQIQQALNKESARLSHDNTTSLKERQLLAQEVAALLLLN